MNNNTDTWLNYSNIPSNSYADVTVKMAIVVNATKSRNSINVMADRSWLPNKS
jgi:hypothetical protein